MQHAQSLVHRHSLGGTCRNSSSRLRRTSAAAKRDGQSAADVRAARLSRILRQYESEGVERQQADLEKYMEQRNAQLGGDEVGASRGLRASAGSRASNERELARMDIYMPYGPNGVRQANYGLHGKGELQWWALRVKPGREKQVAEGLERMVATMLPPLAPLEEGGEARERTIETWVPKKTLKVWSPKSGKMGNKVLRYPARYPDVLVSGENGGWVLARTVLDAELYNRLKANPSFLQWAHVDSFTLYSETGTSSNDRIIDFPRPCSQQVLDEVRDWELDLTPVDEATVRAALDIPVAKPDWADPDPSPQEEWGQRERGRGRPGDRGRGSFGEREGGRGRGRGRGRFEGRGRFDDREREEGAGSGGWFEGGSSSSGGGYGGYRERQGAGLYTSGFEGGDRRERQQRWGEGGERFERRGRREDGFGNAGGGRGGREWQDRGRRDRDGERGAGRRFDDRRESGGAGGYTERRRPREGTATSWSSGSRQGWFEGSSSAGAGAEAGSPWESGSEAPLAGTSGDDAGFTGWFDAAAAAFDVGQPGDGGAAGDSFAAAGSAGAGGSSWSWDEALGQQPAQQQPEGQQQQQQESQQGGAPDEPAVDASGIWDEQPAADIGLTWGASASDGASGGIAYGIPQPQAYPQQGERRMRRDEGRSERVGGRGDRGGRGGRGDRGDRERRGRGRGGERGSRYGERGGGRRGSRDGSSSSSSGWFEGRSSDAEAGSAAADLSWWDADGNDEGAFTGVYSGGSDDWEGRKDTSAGTKASSEGSQRSDRRGRSRSSSREQEGGWDSGSASGESSSADVAAAAAFQPGQQVAVVSGNFRDFEGTVVATQGSRVTAELDIFGKRTRVDLSPSDVSAAGGEDP